MVMFAARLMYHTEYKGHCREGGPVRRGQARKATKDRAAAGRPRRGTDRSDATAAVAEARLA